MLDVFVFFASAFAILSAYARAQTQHRSNYGQRRAKA